MAVVVLPCGAAPFAAGAVAAARTTCVSRGNIAAEADSPAGSCVIGCGGIG